ncbi:hypothetical protein BDV98DRAFT_563268 [Pterulicium gracile]|uniref:Mid2 domain-containing protein n=1 Tax=Pterulicium gracile TaxID=1884261 RepID=A0A5C3QPL4_9AGAR|nr:hypothetical protein BDV98DRAFT_563268 [Pterula gracilis]
MVHRRRHTILNRQTPPAPADPAGGLVLDDTPVNADGISGTKVVGDQDAAAVNTDIQFDDSAVTTAPHIAPDLASVTPTVTDSPPSIPTPTPSLAPETNASEQSGASSQSNISMGTVLGACIGALAGALILIFLAVWWYRKSGKALKRQKRHWHGGERNRSVSGNENWNKLQSGDEDRWAGMMTEDPKAKEMLTRSPSEKLSLFKKDSVKSVSTTTHLPPILTIDHPFASPHNMPNSNGAAPMPQPKDGNASWHDGDSTTDSFAAFRPNIQDRSMSPTVNSALRTPTVTSANTHRWESAEVVHYDHQDDTADDAAAHVNPFFSSRDRDYMTRAKSTSKKPSQPDNPFISVGEAGEEASHGSHQHLSVASDVSSDRAIRSLVAMLDDTVRPPNDGRDDISLRPPSTIPSIYSTNGINGPDDDVTGSFPSPPNNARH